ncbi:MAG: DinB-like domain protein [Gemmatimonadetes bacterium]|nr:DinB-like domain protein [Gemmatimonadota bacterium]
MTQDAALRSHLAKVLDWEEAHATYDKGVDGVPEAVRGRVPHGLPYSPWQLVEHLRITQRDILDFCRDSDYRERAWPDDYWPKDAAPPSPAAWDESLAAYRADRAAMKALTLDESVDLLAAIPHGSGQTYLREILLVADHSAYHVGELVAVRRMLGAWPSS